MIHALLHSNGYEDSADLHFRQEQATASEVERWYRKTKEILSVNRELLDAIANALSAKGVLTGKDIAAIRQTCRVIPVNIA